MRDRILDEIRRDGPIGFDRFMEIALYDPDGGYFAAADSLRSDRGGDFLTSPEVSPLFGETVARFVESEHDRIGGPFSVVEVGAGSGTLLRPLLDSLGFPVTSVVAVERSAAARRALASAVPEAKLAEDLPRTRGVIIANELLDNLPAAILRRTGSGWQERVVGEEGGDLVWTIRDPSAGAVGWADAHAGPVGDDGLVEVQVAATDWVQDALGRLSSGALVLFDYGDLAAGLEPRRAEGTVRTYSRHHLGPDPLVAPGETDITLDVNFTALLSVARDAGADVEVLRQDEFLERWGLLARLDELRSDEREAARDNRVMERLILRSKITEGETLLHPRGLGDFRVLVARK